MSDFGTATLDLMEKAAYRRFFIKRVPKLTEFWNTLIQAAHRNAAFMGTGFPYGQYIHKDIQ